MLLPQARTIFIGVARPTFRAGRADTLHGTCPNKPDRGCPQPQRLRHADRPRATGVSSPRQALRVRRPALRVLPTGSCQTWANLSPTLRQPRFCRPPLTRSLTTETKTCRNHANIPANLENPWVKPERTRLNRTQSPAKLGPTQRKSEESEESFRWTSASSPQACSRTRPVFARPRRVFSSTRQISGSSTKTRESAAEEPASASRRNFAQKLGASGSRNAQRLSQKALGGARRFDYQWTVRKNM